jgi:hypothetical protein
MTDPAHTDRCSTKTNLIRPCRRCRLPPFQRRGSSRHCHRTLISTICQAYRSRAQLPLPALLAVGSTIVRLRPGILLSHVSLTEPGGQAITATGSYGQNLSTGYTYLQRTDGNAFISGTWAVSLQSTDMNGNPVTYTGSIEVGQSEPNSLPEASMAGQTITDSTGAIAWLSP